MDAALPYTQPRTLPRMITGYNTDVRHNEVVFHVQTEDKGEANPFIESLVYVGGQVLAARRAGYAELLADGQGEPAVVAMMERQHRTMIAAIRHGKFDRKLEALRATPDGTNPSPTPGGPATNGLRPGGNSPAVGEVPTDRSLDQVILDYLSAEAEQEQLVLSFGGDTAFVVGKGTSLELKAASSRTGEPVAGADVSVRMISTVTEPQNLARGRTDDSGRLCLDFEIPALGRGTAALIISASSSLGPAEIKQLL
ncbi:MAG TPA: hypothetical protein VM617_01020 [Thermoanaerobaculia bacterium]|nr:hypothetical protein [Thermoanaerobaculia bacterium]